MGKLKAPSDSRPMREVSNQEFDIVLSGPLKDFMALQKKKKKVRRSDQNQLECHNGVLAKNRQTWCRST
jgi:hypothetical protein